MLSRDDIASRVALALPVMVAYVSIGIPCGVMEAQIGFSPLMAFLFSATYYSGAGQFMVSNLWLAGTPLVTMILSISLVTARQLLYSTALSPYMEGVPTPKVLRFGALVTDETFGVNLSRFAARDGWNVDKATVVNVACMLSWATANLIGAAVGSVISLPVDVMSFGMTSVFICLLAGQSWTPSAVRVALVTAASVLACKLMGLGGSSIFLGAVAGVLAGVALDALLGEEQR